MQKNFALSMSIMFDTKDRETIIGIKMWIWFYWWLDFDISLTYVFEEFFNSSCFTFQWLYLHSIQFVGILNTWRPSRFEHFVLSLRSETTPVQMRVICASPNHMCTILGYINQNFLLILFSRYYFISSCIHVDHIVNIINIHIINWIHIFFFFI